MATAEKVLREVTGALFLRPFEILLKLIATTYLMRVLGVESFGAVSTAVAWLTGVGVFCKLGFDSILQVQLPGQKDPLVRAQLIRRALAIRLIIGIAICSGAAFFSQSPWVFWSCLALIIDLLAGFGATVCYARMEARIPALGRLFAPITQIIAVYFVGQSRPELYVLIWLIPSFIQGLPPWLRIIREERFWKSSPATALPFMDWPSSFGIDLSNFALSRLSDVALLGKMGTLMAAGYLSSAQNYFQTLTLVLMSGFSEISVSLYSHLKSENQKELYYLNVFFDMLLLVGPPLILAPILPDLMELVLSHKFENPRYVGTLMAWLIIASIPVRFLGSGTNTTVLWAQKRIPTILKVRLSLGTLNILVNAILLFFWPRAEAVILGTTAVGIVLAAVELFLIKQKGIKHPGKKLFSLTAICISSGIASWLVKHFFVSPLIIFYAPLVGTMIFVALCRILKPLPALPTQIQKSTLVTVYGKFARS